MSKFHVMVFDHKHNLTVTTTMHGYKTFKAAETRALKEGTCEIVRDREYIALYQGGKRIWKKETCGAF